MWCKQWKLQKKILTEPKEQSKLKTVTRTKKLTKNVTKDFSYKQEFLITKEIFEETGVENINREKKRKIKSIH